MLVAVQLSVSGSYLPPRFKVPAAPLPFQTIISLPVHTGCVNLTEQRERSLGSVASPAVCAGIVSPTAVNNVCTSISTPNDHLPARPDRSVVVSRQWAHCAMLVGQPRVSDQDCISRRC